MRYSLGFAVLVISVAARSLAAQTDGDSILTAPLAPGAESHVTPSGDHRLVLGGLLAAAAAATLLDNRIAVESHEVVRQAPFRTLSPIGSAIGGAGPVLLAAGLYVAGRAGGHEQLTRTGSEAFRAVVTSAAATTILKGLVGRERPFAAANDVDVFDPGHGFGGGIHGSFPSGHASGAFAVATVIAGESRSFSRPARVLTEGLAYGSATLVGISRVYENQHWASDVLAGAALGIVAGDMALHRSGDPGGPRHGLKGLLEHVVLEPEGRTNGLGLSFAVH